MILPWAAAIIINILGQETAGREESGEDGGVSDGSVDGLGN